MEFYLVPLTCQSWLLLREFLLSCRVMPYDVSFAMKNLISHSDVKAVLFCFYDVI
ncbi:hypothetical protein Pfo_010604 [Paulownia fortunei]|nr:hypothetical protein Pfo_010604 [Paulownia fortunei]